MKNIIRLLSVCFLLHGYTLRAQSDLQNTGTLYISTGSDILYITGAFTNATTGALTNNGNLYVRQNLINGQAAMTVGTGTLFLNGTSAQTVSGAQVFKTFNLNTNNSAGITLNANLDVNGTHTFSSGVITTSATPNYLIYEAGSSYTGDGNTKHVNGWVKKFGNTAFTFPVGNGTFERVANLSSFSASSEFNAIYRSTTPNRMNLLSPIMDVEPGEYWEINRISGGTVVVTLNWNNTYVTFPDYLMPDIRVAQYNAGLWTNRGGTASGNVYSSGSVISGAAVNNFGFFTIGSVGVALPLRFVNISAQRQQASTKVQWNTADENNVDHYEVERSGNGSVFTAIGSVKSNNSNTGSQYEFTDALPLQGKAYYRIRAVDKDGKVTYSGIVAVSDNTNRTESLYVLNNPAHQSIYLYGSDLYKGAYRYELLNTAGQLTQKGQLTVSGNSIVSIPLSDKAQPGSYILIVHNEAHRLAEKILIR